MKVVFVSNLYPDTVEPGRGLPNARLVRHLSERAEVRVIAPRPTLPFRPERPRTPCAEDRAVAPVFPFAWYVPKVGSRVNHLLMALALRAPLARLAREFHFDAVLAAWVYPDGCAVAELSRLMGFPFAVVAQGLDVYDYLKIPARRRIITRLMARSGAVITRSQRLARLLGEAGVPPGLTHVIYNGVNTDVFRPGDLLAARRELGWPAESKTVLYVGELLPVKNPLLLVDAFAQLQRRLPEAQLVMVGDGTLRSVARARAQELGVSAKVLFLGLRPEREVAGFMRAADVLCIPSRNEGVPNVMLEAFASGLPVVATRVGGIPEILDQDYLGALVEPGNAPALADALFATLAVPRRRDEILARAQRHSWPDTAGAYLALLERAVGQGT